MQNGDHIKRLLLWFPIHEKVHLSICLSLSQFPSIRLQNFFVKPCTCCVRYFQVCDILKPTADDISYIYISAFFLIFTNTTDFVLRN